MLKEHATLFRRLTIAADLFLVGLAFFAGYVIRSGMAQGLAPVSFYLRLLPGLLVIWGTLLMLFGMYASFRLKRVREILTIVFRAAFLGFVLFGGYLYIFKITNISRSFVLIVFVLTAAFVTIEKIAMIMFFRRLRRRGFNYRLILIVGSGRRAQKFINNVNEHRDLGLRIVGIVDDGPDYGHFVAGVPVIGSLVDIPEILKQESVDHVIFIVPRAHLSKIEPSILHCETTGVTVSVAVDLFDLQFTTGQEGSILGQPLITFEMTTQKIGQLLFKRMLDIGLSVMALFFIFPVYAAIAMLIKLTSPGPVYFVQERCGMRGRRFNLYKFRTMVADAEDRLQELLAHNEMDGPVFKIKNDPRLTRIGKFLRKTSLDELPQLWNVLKGHMSLVGPRPPLPREVDQYDHWHRRRLSMRPGITCLWQVNGRNLISDFDQWMRLDLQYIDQWSLVLDLKILFRTIPVVLRGTGAS